MSAQYERDLFWDLFDEHVKQDGNKFFITHEKGGVNQAAGNVNNISPMAMETVCCEYKYLEQTILVQLYLNKNEKLFDYLFSEKENFEKRLGYEVEWVKGGKKSASVRRIQKQFPINKPIKDMVKEVYPYVLDFIRVFGDFV